MNEMTPTIDLSKGKNLDESFLRMFGGAVQAILKAMFQGTSIPVKIKGTRGEVHAFMEALRNEKNFLEAYRSYGLETPMANKHRLELEKSIEKFQRKTGIVWPLY